MFKRILIVLITLCEITMFTSCTTYKEIRKKDYPSDKSSFSVVSFLNYGLEGEGYSRNIFSNKQYKFDSTKIDWDVDFYASNLLKNFLKEKNFQLVDIKYDDNFFVKNPSGNLLQIVQNVEAINKNLPDYYFILVPFDTIKEYVTPDSALTASDPSLAWTPLVVLTAIVNPVPAITLASISIDHQHKQYKDLELSDESLYKHQPSQLISKTNFKAESLGKSSSCNVAFGLFMVERKQQKIIAFSTRRFASKLPKNYDIIKFSDWNNFNQEEKIEIRNGCLEAINKGMKASLKQIGILETEQPVR